MIVFLDNSLAVQGIYQLFVSSSMGRIFGREIKVEFMGKLFLSWFVSELSEKDISNVVVQCR